MAMDLYVTLKFRCNDVIEEEALNIEFGGNLMQFMRYMLDDDHIISFSDDNGVLVAVSEAHKGMNDE